MTITKHSRVVIRPPHPTAVVAERTRIHANGAIQTWEETVYLYVVEDVNCRRFAKLAGGPTGREMFELTPDNIRRFQTRGWIACEGTVGGPDRLVISRRWLAVFFSVNGIDIEDIEVAA